MSSSITWTVTWSLATVSSARANTDIVIVVLPVWLWRFCALRKITDATRPNGGHGRYCTIVSPIPWYWPARRRAAGNHPDDGWALTARPNRHLSVIDLWLAGGALSGSRDGHEGPAMESELSRVIAALPGLVWTALPDGQFDFINQRWSEYTGLEVDASHGRGWQVAVHPGDLPGLLDGWRGGRAPGAPVETEVRLRGSDGNYRWFLF